MQQWQLFILVLITICYEVGASHPAAHMTTAFKQKGCYNDWPAPKHQDEEIFLSVPDLIRYRGYAVESHDVETEDGYILTVFRIPHGKTSKHLSENRKVVLLQHGLSACASNWVTNFDNQSLAFILADEGHDVWMGNSRGNTYSRRHKTLSPEEDTFWYFSYDQMARFDLPAMVSYALRVSGQASLYYVGHSQGTMMAFAALSYNASLAHQIKTLIALGPVATLGYIKSPIRFLAPFASSLADAWYIFGNGEFFPHSELLDFLGELVCEKPLLPICYNIIFAMAGWDCKSINMTRLPVYVGHVPAGTSAMNMVHFAQGILYKTFAKYDFGKEENMKTYGQPTPPKYNLRNITTPVAIFWGGKDYLADADDIQLNLIPNLKNIVRNSYIAHYDHLDFIWAVDAYNYVYKDILKLIK